MRRTGSGNLVGAVALHCCCCRRLKVLLGSAGFCAPVQRGARTQPRFWTVEDWMFRSEFLLCCSSRRSSTPGSLGAPCLGGGVPPLEEILDPSEGRGLMSGVVVSVLDQNLGVTGLGPEARKKRRALLCCCVARFQIRATILIFVLLAGAVSHLINQLIYLIKF